MQDFFISNIFKKFVLQRIRHHSTLQDTMGTVKRDIRIANKEKRKKVFAEMKHKLNKERHEMRRERAKEEAKNPELKEKRLAENVPDTIEAKRVYDETIAQEMEGEDEFKEYFEEGKPPKVLITTSKRARGQAYDFADLLYDIIPGSEFKKRVGDFTMTQIAKMCAERDYTDLVVINEDKKKVNGLTFIHLPEGPTMYFSVSSLKMPKEIKGHGRSTTHIPELILNNFSTRLGKTVGRLFQSMFPQQPEFVGRQVVTLHNQRDWIFFRRHRYVFKNEERVGLQELGPQFTLRLRRLQRGIRGEVEWEHRSAMDKDKKKFHL
jgi:ribosome production factor 1